MQISLICPTRGRPYNCYRFWQSAFDCCINKKSLEVIFYIDADDLETQEQITWMQEEFTEQVKYIIGERIKMSAMNNQCASVAAGEILMYAGDDIVFKTKGFDKIVREAFVKYPDKLALVYGDDGINHQGKLATHGFLHRKHMDVLGYFLPDYFSAFFADTTVSEMYYNLGRLIYVDIVTDHLHYSVQKAFFDKTTEEMHERNRRDQNELVWYNSLPRRVADTEKLLAYINNVNNTNIELTKYERIL